MACRADSTRLARLPSICVEGHFVLGRVFDFDDDRGAGSDGGVGFERDGQVEGERGEGADFGSDEAGGLRRRILDGDLVELVYGVIICRHWIQLPKH